MRTLIIILTGIHIFQSIACQNPFLSFLDKFPKYSWKELPKDILLIDKPNNNIDADLINKYFFDIDNIEKMTKENPHYTVPSPHILYRDGKWGKGIGGRFSSTWNGRPTTIKPLARVAVNDSIVLLFIYYKNVNEEYEVYTFNRKTEMLLSSLRLYTDEEFCVSFINKDLTINFIKSYYVDDKKTLFYETYKLRGNGYFQEIEVVNMTKSNIFLKGKVKDKDGYSNVRNKPDLKSEIIYTAKNNMIIYVKNLPNTDWYKVLLYFDDYESFISRKLHTEGYIHKSRVIRE